MQQDMPGPALPRFSPQQTPELDDHFAGCRDSGHVLHFAERLPDFHWSLKKSWPVTAQRPSCRRQAFITQGTLEHFTPHTVWMPRPCSTASSEGRACVSFPLGAAVLTQDLEKACSIRMIEQSNEQ